MRSQINLQGEKQNPGGVGSEGAEAERDGSWAPRSGERGDCTDPPICPGDDEIGAGGGGEGADEDGGEEEEEEGGAAERRRRSRHLPAARSRRGVWLDRGRGA